MDWVGAVHRLSRTLGRRALAAAGVAAVLLQGGIDIAAHAQGRSRTALRTSCNVVNVACRRGLVDRLVSFAVSHARPRTPEYTACLRKGYQQLSALENDFTALDLSQIDCVPELQDYSPQYQQSLESLLRTAKQAIATDPNARITFGRLARPCDFPNTVAIKSGNSLCSGVLVDDRAVLTAAHCICSLGIENEEGSYNRNVTAQVRVKAGEAANASTSWIGLNMSRPYAKFNNQFSCPRMLSGPEWGRDVAVLLLREPLESNCPRQFRPARIVAPAAYLNPDAQVFTIVGFGRDEHGVSGIKRWATVSVVSKICGNGVEQSNYRCLPGREGVFADPDLLRDTCSGDSGGPVYLHVGGRQDVVAITSRGVRGSACGPGGLYTLVSPAVVTWMRDQGIAINGGSN